VTEVDGEFLYEGQPVTREYGKMGKSLKNAMVTPTTCATRTAPTRCACTR
jgi:leucyl-tRNA synthetase